MATGDGHGVGTIFNKVPSSAVIAYDHACTHCVQNNGSYSAASNYCPDCDVYFCRPCLHKYPCEHGSLGKAKIGRWGNPTIRNSGELCKKHASNLIQLYCRGHDEVGCHIYIAKCHQHCTSLVYITDEVCKTSTKQEIESTEREFMEMKSKLSEAANSRVVKINALESSYNDLKKEMQDFRRKINDLLDDLEKQSMGELDAMKRKLGDQIDNHSQNCESIVHAIDSLLRKLQQYNIDDTLRFIWLNQSRKALEEGKKVSSERVQCTDPLPFEFHTEIETCLKGFEGFGKFYKKDKATTKQTDMPNSLQKSDTVSTSQADMPYSVQKKDSFNIKQRRDRKTSDIISMCQLTDGSFVLSDFSNKCLKHVSASHKLRNRLHLQQSPYGVCSTGDQEVAVALDNDSVLFVSVGSEMVATTKIQLKYECCDLAYSNEKLYITNWGSSVHVYNRSGAHVRELRFDQHLSSNDVTSYFKQISVKSCGCKAIYVTNPNKNLLLAIDNTGKVIRSFSPAGVRLMQGICMDNDGNVFVCGKESDNIIQISSTGDRKITDIVRPQDCIKSPMGLCFDRINARLLVFFEKSDEVYVLDLVETQAKTRL